MGQEASDLSRQPGGLPRSLELPRETAVQAVPETEGKGSFPPLGPSRQTWSLPMVRQLRVGLEPDSPTGRPALPPGTEDASTDDGVIIKASLS